MACCEPQFSKLKEEINEPELKKQKIEAGDTDSSIDDHVKIEKDKAEEAKEEDYDSDNDFNNCYKKDGDTKRVRIMTIESLKWYNKEMGSNYKLKRVLSADRFLVSGFSFVIKFIAEEGESDDEPDELPLEFLKSSDELNEKVSYYCGDIKVSDKFFLASVYWKVHVGTVSVNSCEIITEQEANVIG